MIDRLRRWLAVPGSDPRGVERAIKKLSEALRDQATALEARIAAVGDQVSQRATAKDATEIFHAIRSLAAASDQSRDAEIYKALDLAAKGSGPIVVGPWTGEVGFEVLYWIPFVEWFRTRWRVDPRRFVIVSRGGVGTWYGLPDARYVDIFSMVTPEAFRARADPDEHKQRSHSAFEQEMTEAVRRAHGLSGTTSLHPSLLYRALARFWRDEAGVGLIERFSLYRRLQPFDHPGTGSLPSDYVAVRFYFNDCFPDMPANRELAGAVVNALSRRSPVVLLNPGLHVDDHRDFAPAAQPNVYALGAILPPEENLAIQSAVISHARAFVGTYGGLSYIAPLYGVPSVAFYSARAFKQHHLYVAQRVFERLGTPMLMPIDTAHASAVHSATAL